MEKDLIVLSRISHQNDVEYENGNRKENMLSTLRI